MFGSLQLTSLKYVELYGLGGFGAVSALETIRRRREVLRDPRPAYTRQDECMDALGFEGYQG